MPASAPTPGGAATTTVQATSATGSSLHESEQNKENQEGVNHKYIYVFRVSVVYFLLLVDMILNSTSSSDNYFEVQNNLSIPVLLVSAQVVCQLFLFTIVFLMMVGTYLFRVGMLSVLVEHFKLMGFAMVTYFILTAVLGILRILEFARQHKTTYGPEYSEEYRGSRMKKDIRELWLQGNGYLVVFVIQNVFSALYYFTVIEATMKLSEPRFYHVAPWAHRYSER